MSETDAVFLRDADRPNRNAYLLRIGKTDQSYVDLDDPSHLEFDYVQRIAAIVDLVGEPGLGLRVVHIGGAGMTLPRYIAHTRPGSQQIVLEPDAALTERVRERLPLPRLARIKVRPIAGRAGVAEMPSRFCEVLIVDAFHRSQVPPELTTIEALTEYARVLTPGGVLLLNITDRGMEYARRVVSGVGAVFPQVLLAAEANTLRGRRFGNVVIGGAQQAFDLNRITADARRAVYQYRVLSGAELTKLIAGATGFTDADSSWSPLPPGLFLS